MSVNRVTLLGYIGNISEVKQVSGVSVLNLSLATSEKWKDKDGIEQQKTEWHRLSAWRGTAEAIAKFFKKGDPIYIEGKLQTRSWTDDKEVKREVTEIVVLSFDFCGKKKDTATPPPPSEGDMPPADFIDKHF